jgi:tetraacyldisaccharide 4'-kinase
VRLLKILLYPVSVLYGFIIVIRNLFFDIGIFKIRRVNVPVISIGNITVGGTGKTPIVEYLLIHYASECGDEPLQIASKFSRAIVIVDENRYRAAKLAEEKFKCDIILMDDGFQHRKLHRDFDAVVIDVTKPLDNDCMLPSGLKREPLSSLKRADAIIFSRWNDSKDFEIDKFDYCALTVKAQFLPKRLVNIMSGEILDLKSINGKKVAAFCGIGNPNSFFKTIQEIGAEIIAKMAFPDHNFYNQNELYLIKRDFLNNKPDLIITTEKDAVRLLEIKDKILELPIYYLEIFTQLVEGEKEFFGKINTIKRTK